MKRMKLPRTGSPPWLVAYWCWSLRALYRARGIPVVITVMNGRAALWIHGRRPLTIVFGWCSGAEVMSALTSLRNSLRPSHGLN